MTLAPSVALVLTLAFTSVAVAGAQNVSPELRQRAIQTCTGDAVRLCPEALMDEGEAISCMAGKRTQLTQSCRIVYDQVARLLRQ